MGFFGDVLSGVASSALGIAGGLMTNSAANSAASANRDWQERMSSTAHQREVKDLRAAGLNPILSGMGGSGAQSGPGATAMVTNPMDGAVQNAHSGYKLSSEKRLMEQQIDGIHAAGMRDIAAAQNNTQQARLARVNQDVAAAQQVKTLEEVNTTRALAANYAAQARQALSQSGLNSARAYHEEYDIDKRAKAAAGRATESITNFFRGR